MYGPINNNEKRDSWSNGARIGLAFRVCYQQWVKSEMNIFKNREIFVKNSEGEWKSTHSLDMNDIPKMMLGQGGYKYENEHSSQTQGNDRACPHFYLMKRTIPSALK